MIEVFCINKRRKVSIKDPMTKLNTIRLFFFFFRKSTLSAGSPHLKILSIFKIALFKILCTS